jgi:hypothetical protein
MFILHDSMCANSPIKRPDFNARCWNATSYAAIILFQFNFRFSHGYVVHMAELRAYVEPDFRWIQYYYWLTASPFLVEV